MKTVRWKCAGCGATVECESEIDECQCGALHTETMFCPCGRPARFAFDPSIKPEPFLTKWQGGTTRLLN